MFVNKKELVKSAFSDLPPHEQMSISQEGIGEWLNNRRRNKLDKLDTKKFDKLLTVCEKLLNDLKKRLSKAKLDGQVEVTNIELLKPFVVGGKLSTSIVKAVEKDISLMGDLLVVYSKMVLRYEDYVTGKLKKAIDGGDGEELFYDLLYQKTPIEMLPAEMFKSDVYLHNVYLPNIKDLMNDKDWNTANATTQRGMLALHAPSLKFAAHDDVTVESMTMDKSIAKDLVNAMEKYVKVLKDSKGLLNQFNSAVFAITLIERQLPDDEYARYLHTIKFIQLSSLDSTQDEMLKHTGKSIKAVHALAEHLMK